MSAFPTPPIRSPTPREDLEAQADPNADGLDAFQKRYAKAQARDFDGNPAVVSEGDALIAYLQMLGTLVEFQDLPRSRPREPEIDMERWAYEDVLAFAQSWGAVYFVAMFIRGLCLCLVAEKPSAL